VSMSSAVKSAPASFSGLPISVYPAHGSPSRRERSGVAPPRPAAPTSPAAPLLALIPVVLLLEAPPVSVPFVPPLARVPPVPPLPPLATALALGSPALPPCSSVESPAAPASPSWGGWARRSSEQPAAAAMPASTSATASRIESACRTRGVRVRDKISSSKTLLAYQPRTELWAAWRSFLKLSANSRAKAQCDKVVCSRSEVGQVMHSRRKRWAERLTRTWFLQSSNPKAAASGLTDSSQFIATMNPHDPRGSNPDKTPIHEQSSAGK